MADDRRRWRLLAAGAAALAVAVAAPLAFEQAGERAGGDGVAARTDVLGRLPPGFAYLPVEPELEAATEASVRQATGAEEVVVRQVGAADRTSPLGVRVVRMRLPAPLPPGELARRLAEHVPLQGAEPRELQGRTVLVRDDDVTFASSALWVDGSTALVAYGSTTAEVLAVLAVLVPRQ